METILNKSAGMGAILTDDASTTFRVWAPNADKVFVIGDFNDWKKDEFELELEDNGYWAGVTEKCKEGDEYKFLIINGKNEYERNDPYAVEVTNSNGNSIARKLDFDWEGDDFQILNWNELVIYELHVGTFNRKKPDQVGTFEDVIEKLP
ncbi:MAG: alpha-amylase family glycosyl hydrolase, partial [Zobellia laminariae]